LLTGPPTYTESDLLLAAYEKWREDCPRFLIGEFAFAVFDSRNRRLFCCRDQIGFRPFFYHRQGSRFVFAGDVRSILAMPGVERRLNERKFAGLIFCGGHNFCPEESFHTGIGLLPSAGCLTAELAGVRPRSYWTPEVRTGIVPRRPAEAFEALRELLFRAIGCRLEDGVRPGAELSGGLDSSAITSVAARCLADRGGELDAFAGVLPDEQRASLEDERDYIDEFRSWPNIRIHYVTAPGAGPFDSIENPAIFEASPVRTSRTYLYDAFEQAATDSNTQVILQGNLGELGPTCPGHRYFTELATSLRWPTLVRELRALRETSGINPFRFMAGRFRDLLQPLPGQRRPPFVLLAPNFVPDRKVLERLRFFSPDQRGHQAAQIRRFLRIGSQQTGQTSQGRVRVSQPLLDKRVLEFCLSAPPELKVRNGYTRNLVREALDGVLPPKIQWRTSKAPFSPDYFVRYNSQLPKAREFVRAIGPKDPVRSVIDIPRLGALLRAADPSDPGSAEAIGDTVPATFYAICFLRQFAEYRP
jgi:asparagine synthase (glutamine-hydrolysing)